MGLSIEYIIYGAKFVYGLDSFPLFCGYLLMVLLAGIWKRYTSPLSLRPILVVYNLSASAVSLYTLYGIGLELWRADSTFVRQTSDQLKFVYKVYWYVKIFELLDTVFMILRHRQRQISFLHVYHHGSMLLLSDISYNSYPYISIALYLALNSAVHVLLYLYYGLSALYPDNPPQWKKGLTQFQIIQFITDIIHVTIGYLYYNHCVYGIFYCLAMIVLFSNFYIKAYTKRPMSQSSLNKKEK